MAHIFDPARLHEIARAAVGLPHEPMVKTVVDGLHAAYPGHIARVPRWVISRAGGAMGMMMVLHGSLSEYVLLYGSPIGTEGFSGRYRVEVYDFVLAGEMWTYTEDAAPSASSPGPARSRISAATRPRATASPTRAGCWSTDTAPSRRCYRSASPSRS
jgi:hypothetical protein